MSRDEGIVAVSDHGGWAVLVTVAGDGTLLDRRRVEWVMHLSPGVSFPGARERAFIGLLAARLRADRIVTCD